MKRQRLKCFIKTIQRKENIMKSNTKKQYESQSQSFQMNEHMFKDIQILFK